MDPSLFKANVRALLGDVTFLGPQFDEIVRLLSPDAQNAILTWLDAIIKREYFYVPKHGFFYKGIPARELIVFRKAFSIENNALRILLIKVKNSYYWEFHVGKHAYYDDVRRQLRLK